MDRVVPTFQMHHAWWTPTTEKNVKRNSQTSSILKQFSTKMDTLFIDVMAMWLPLQRQSMDKQLPSTIAMLSHIQPIGNNCMSYMSSHSSSSFFWRLPICVFLRNSSVASAAFPWNSIWVSIPFSRGDRSKISLFLRFSISLFLCLPHSLQRSRAWVVWLSCTAQQCSLFETWATSPIDGYLAKSSFSIRSHWEQGRGCI